MEKNRLYWASRRGMLELDLVLTPFLDHHYDQIDNDDKQRFKKLLAEEDQDLFRWFMNSADPDDPELLKIVRIVRQKTGPHQ